MPDEPEILTTKEAAAWLHVHPSTMYRLAKHNKIPAFKVGSDYRFDRRQLEEWTRARTVSGEPVITQEPGEPARKKSAVNW